MTRRSFALLFFAKWLYPQSPTVRVRLFALEQPREIRITDASGETILINIHQNTPHRSSGPVTLERTGNPGVRLQYPVEVTATGGGLMIINELPLEEYVAAVLAGESLGFRASESLSALAVAVRSYALHFMNRHQAEGFQFCDTTHCQDFRITAVTDRLRLATADTRGQVLRYGGQPIAAYYQKDCGGITEAQGPYLPQLSDRFCTVHGRLRWTAELKASDLQAVFGIEAVSAFEIVGRTASGRAQQVRLRGSESRIVDARTFRLTVGRKIGWSKIQSDLYDVRPSGTGFMFEGYGAGHGLGLCQDGAAAMGEQGFSYRDILGYYYPNTTFSAGS